MINNNLKFFYKIALKEPDTFTNFLSYSLKEILSMYYVYTHLAQLIY